MASILPRITARVDHDTQNLLQQAAAVSGISSINSFVLNAAIEKAKKIIEHEHYLELTRRDAISLSEALDSEAKTHKRLQEAASRYHRKKQ